METITLYENCLPPLGTEVQVVYHGIYPCSVKGKLLQNDSFGIGLCDIEDRKGDARIFIPWTGVGSVTWRVSSKVAGDGT